MTELIEEFQLEWQGRTILVIAPDAGELGATLRSARGARSVDSLETPDGIGPELEERIYDVAVVGDVLYELAPTSVYDALRWVRDHLNPGGQCLVHTRTWLGPDGGGLGSRVRTPYAHVAFARDAVEEYFAANGWEPPPVANRMCRATYLMLFRRAGLEIEDVRIDEHMPQAFHDKLQTYDQAELRAAGIRARLRRPEDEERELAELRSLLIPE